MDKHINIFNISDIHLGHDKNKTEDIVNNLRRFFKTYRSRILKTDLLVISGDVTDRLLASNSHELLLMNMWFTELLKICSEYNIVLRVLEGTPSHDWKQVKLIYNIIDALKIDVDFKYMENLDIEHIDRFDIDILYVPDEWKDTSEELYKDVLRKLKEHKIDKVDIAIMHGNFNYQLPDFVEDKLIPEDYFDVVKYLIIIGHIHQHSNYEIILTPGSFDALTHADTDKKGGLFITLNLTTGKFKYEFLENKHKLRFRSIDVKNLDIHMIKDKLKKIHDNKLQYVRLLINNDNIISSNMLEFKKLFPNIVLTLLDKEKDKKKSNRTLDKSIGEYSLNNVKLDKDTIGKYIVSRIEEDNLEIIIKNNILKELDTLM